MKKHVPLFTRRLADLLNGGLTLSRSLEVLRDQAGNKQFGAVLAGLGRDLQSGKAFSTALARRGDLFLPIYIGLVRAGESSGRLEESLEELSRLLEAEREAREKVCAALIYPAILMVLSLLVCLFLGFFVIPRFQFLFDDLGQSLPWPTRLLIGSTSFLRNHILLILGAAGGAALIFFNKRKTMRRASERMILRLPWVRDWVRGVFLQQWARVMSSLLRSGFPVLEALQLSRQAAGAFSEDIRSASRDIIDGRNLSEALRYSRFAPVVVVEMVAAGEESGRLDEALGRVAQAYLRETEQQMKIGLSLIEPALMVAMGAVVGFVALAMLLPIFEMSAGLK